MLFLTNLFLRSEEDTWIMGDVKNFLYAWCGKRKMTPTYEIRAVGNKNRQKFMCEVLKKYSLHLCDFWGLFYY